MFQRTKKAYVFLGLVCAYLVYTGFIYWSLPRNSYKTDRAILQGKELWQEYNCVACHQIYGLGGFLGPDLTNTYSEKGPGYIKAFLKSGTAVMPNFNLSDEEMEAIMAYMKDIDASGEANPKSFKLNSYGTIEQ